eukprot:gene24915-biopygen20930
MGKGCTIVSLILRRLLTRICRMAHLYHALGWCSPPPTGHPRETNQWLTFIMSRLLLTYRQLTKTVRMVHSRPSAPLSSSLPAAPTRQCAGARCRIGAFLSCGKSRVRDATSYFRQPDEERAMQVLRGWNDMVVRQRGGWCTLHGASPQTRLGARATTA